MDEAARLGCEAQSVLDNQAFKAVVQSVRDRLWRKFETVEDSSEGDEEARRLRRQAASLGDILSDLKRLRDKGVEAEKKAARAAENQPEKG